MIFTNKLRVAAEHIVRRSDDGHCTVLVDLCQTGRDSGKLVLEVMVAPDTDVVEHDLSPEDQASLVAGEWGYSRANLALRVAASDLYIGRRLIAIPDGGDDRTRIQRWHMLLSTEALSLANSLIRLNGIEIAVKVKGLDLYSDQRATR